MARIRSVKPDFFTSEKVASLSLSARLTFIGLWTYVDDNGVGLDNERLIVAAIWPLEDDPLETLRRTREDLRSLQETLLVTRYRDGERHLLHIRSWSEHQKVSHPGKPRYPLPDTPEVTSDNPKRGRHSGNPPETLRSPPETFRPEQGAGSREQGAGMRSAPAAADAATAPNGLTQTQRSKALTDAYAAAEPMCKWPAVNAIVLKAIQAARWSDGEIHDALLRLAKEGRGVTVETLRVELNGLPPLPRRTPTTDERVRAGLDLAAQYAAEERRELPA